MPPQNAVRGPGRLPFFLQPLTRFSHHLPVEARDRPVESAQAYPDSLRRVSYFDAATNKRLKFLTNNFTLPALTIARIYKSRWQIELFFKWIKQHLRIKKFYGTSENAVKTQIWIAVSVYVITSLRLPAVLTVLFKYTSARQAARASY